MATNNIIGSSAGWSWRNMPSTLLHSPSILFCHTELTHAVTFLCVDRGCIFPTIHPIDGPFLPTSLHAFAAARTEWPCTLKACQILLSTKMLCLVVSLLGKGACLFNDQVQISLPIGGFVATLRTPISYQSTRRLYLGCTCKVSQ